MIASSWLFLAMTFLFGCSRTERVIGRYAAIGYNNTHDTIILNTTGVYVRKVYDVNNKLCLDMRGRWEYNNDLLVMSSFFLNLDRDITRFPALLADTSMRMEVSVEHRDGKVRFCTGYIEGKNCYEKCRVSSCQALFLH